MAGALLGGACFLVSGCAGLVTAWKNDPLQVYNVKGPSIYAMTGDRRTAVMMEENPKHRFCAESLPDAVAAFAASSKARAGITGKGDAEFSDATTAGLLQTFQRTEIAEVYRQMGWNTCLAWLQGAITQPQYHELLKKMVEGGVDVMSRRAAQPVPAPTLPYTTLKIDSAVFEPGAIDQSRAEAEEEPEANEGEKPKPGEKEKLKG